MPIHPPESGSDTPPSVNPQTNTGGGTPVNHPASGQGASTEDKTAGATSREPSPPRQKERQQDVTETAGPDSKNAPAAGKAPAAERAPRRLHVQHRAEETWEQRLSHWGPTVTSTLTSIISIALAFVVWQSGKQLGERQVKLQEEQVQAELADMRTKFFDDLMASDENKRTYAEIGLAGHGQKAMPVVHLALGVEVEAIRESGANVVHRLFQSEVTPEGRWQIIRKLTEEEFNSPNKNLRLGIVQSLVRIEPLLEPDERQKVTGFLEQRVIPEDACYPEGREMVRQAATFFSDKNPRRTDYLLKIARVPRCGQGWVQTLVKLRTVADQLAPPQRAELRESLVRLKDEVLGNLRRSVSDEDLKAGIGFGQSMQNGRLVVNFEVFKQEVEKQFAELLDDIQR
jgi:hypothetical protein